jgi:hypothetical protein
MKPSSIVSTFSTFPNDVSACFSYKLPYKSICANMYTDSYKAVRAEGVKGNLATKLSQFRCGINETVCHIKDNLLGAG